LATVLFLLELLVLKDSMWGFEHGDQGLEDVVSKRSPTSGTNFLLMRDMLGFRALTHWRAVLGIFRYFLVLTREVEQSRRKILES
jgi:hypothetical protein